jgi:hypothetical protein
VDCADGSTQAPALVGTPRLLLLDEPTTGLGPAQPQPAVWVIAHGTPAELKALAGSNMIEVCAHRADLPALAQALAPIGSEPRIVIRSDQLSEIACYAGTFLRKHSGPLRRSRQACW